MTFPWLWYFENMFKSPVLDSFFKQAFNMIRKQKWLFDLLLSESYLCSRMENGFINMSESSVLRFEYSLKVVLRTNIFPRSTKRILNIFPVTWSWYYLWSWYMFMITSRIIEAICNRTVFSVFHNLPIPCDC